ncbi:MAG: translational GTPase TypA [Clostridia bacterium]|nr:translational GTPase TypA [Clostridia bacterium]
MVRHDIRNVAIIAHVDHGKTTLVDQMLKQGGMFRSNQQINDRVMDSNDLERERGITILAKNTSIHYKDIKINIIDTPGHADFGGEVERVLKMVNGVLVLVDAIEGPMPQTRFVLQKALELGHKLIIVVNKIDRADSLLEKTSYDIFELLVDLNASEEQLDSPIIYCSGREGTATMDYKNKGKDLVPLFEKIINFFDPPEGDETAPLQLLVSAIDYNDFVGRIGIGRIERGSATAGSDVIVTDYHNITPPYRGKLVNMYQIEGLKRIPIEKADVGDIICFSGIENITIGQTVCAVDTPEPLPFVKISEPTIEMTFSVNDSPFAGKEGKFITTRHLKERLFKEMLKDVSLRVENTSNADTFKVFGRGEMHISILIETMRREGYEFAVSPPKVIYKTIDGKIYEPIDKLIIDVPQNHTGTVMEKMGQRKGELTHMNPMGSRIRMEFTIPSRGLFGYKNEFLTDTKGEGVMNSVFLQYEQYRGAIPRRQTGSLVAYETGEAVTYGLYNAQERGVLFITPGTKVYEGMVVGYQPKAEDIRVNVCKKKHITNMRSSSSDEALRLQTPRVFSMEECLEFIGDDERLEVTPKSLRIRKNILDFNSRQKAAYRAKE